MKRSLASAASATARFERDAAATAAQLLGGLAASLDEARQLALVLSSEQGNLANVVQVETDGIIHNGAVQPFVKRVEAPTTSEGARRCTPWRAMLFRREGQA